MNVLIIDNTTLFHKILTGIFADSKSELIPIFCDTASQGLAELDKSEIGFICISMYLEDTDGIQLTRTIRQTHHHTPIILFTSDESYDVYADALSAGVTEVFQKKELQQLINFINRFTQQQQVISGRVLYIEDTLSQRQMVTQLFTQSGLEVDAYAAAEDAWESYLEQSYDLVVTDIVLEGGMTGMALTNRIRRLDGEKGDVPILALTGFDDISRRIDLFYLGISDYVIKPVIAEELLARVRSLINGRRFYMESEKQRQRAETADKAKSAFISHMSHELRTPLNAILGFGQMLEMDAADFNQEQQSNISEILNAGEHLLNLINDLLDMAKIESGRLDISIAEVSIDDILRECVNLIYSQIREQDIEVINQIKGQSYHVQADYMRLKQVVLNLLTNATKYNREHGRITIDAEIKPDNLLRLAITDTGKGLTEEQRNNLFIPFERLGVLEEVEGAGIGLVICKRLTELMGGSIGVESVAGEGSTFWLELRLAIQETSGN